MFLSIFKKNPLSIVKNNHYTSLRKNFLHCHIIFYPSKLANIVQNDRLHQKNFRQRLHISPNTPTFATFLERGPLDRHFQDAVDSLAQLVEHNTFNVGVVGSSPTRITKVFGRILQNTATGSVAVFFLYVQTASECALCDTRVGKSWANNPWAFLPTIENPDTLL